MLPESWTARSGLLLLAVVAVVLCAGLWLGLPPEPVQGIDAAAAAQWTTERTAFVLAWMGQAVGLLTIPAGVLGMYGARNLPTSSRAATTAEKRAGYIVPPSVRGEP